MLKNYSKLPKKLSFQCPEMAEFPKGIFNFGSLCLYYNAANAVFSFPIHCTIYQPGFRSVVCYLHFSPLNMKRLLKFPNC